MHTAMAVTDAACGLPRPAAPEVPKAWVVARRVDAAVRELPPIAPHGPATTRGCCSTAGGPGNGGRIVSGRELSRSAGVGRAAPPVRLIHLGLGNFFRAHQAWYTEHAPDADEWGIAAFSGRSRTLADELTAQEGLYTLVTRAADTTGSR